MSQQAIGFHQREINRRMAERGMPTAAWSAEQVAYERMKQLPEEMLRCTIRFVECEVGHGRLTATNWVQHGCQKCEIDRLRDYITQMDVDMERLAYERNEARAQLAKVNESPYSPAFMAAIAGTCSTPASRVGKTQAEVFDEEKK